MVSYQLRALGHGTIWDPANDARAWDKIQFRCGADDINVIIEGFTPSTIRQVAAAQCAGARFLCLATEEPTPLGFNHGTQREMVMRQQLFSEAMRYFEGILHLVPGQHVTDWYAQHAPTGYVELGYAPQLVRPERVPNPRFEFGFFGSVTPRRRNLLNRLFRRMGKPPNAVRIVSDFISDTERDLAMQDCKVILQIRKFDAMGLVSSSRCNTGLCLGRPVVAEPHDLSKPWDEIVAFASTEEEFYQLAMLTARRWRDAHHFQMKRFKERLTPEVCVGQALRAIELGRHVRRVAA